MSKVKTWQLVVAAVVLFVVGGIVMINGSIMVSRGEADQAVSSYSTFGDVLGFNSGSSAQAAEGARRVSTGHTLQGVAWVMWLAAAALVVTGVRRSRRGSSPALAGDQQGHASPATYNSPATHSAPAPASPVDPAEGAVKRKPCPSCRESISVLAKVCRFCGIEVVSPAGAS